jgi:hypothetical protein
VTSRDLPRTIEPDDDAPDDMDITALVTVTRFAADRLKDNGFPVYAAMLDIALAPFYGLYSDDIAVLRDIANAAADGQEVAL